MSPIKFIDVQWLERYIDIEIWLIQLHLTFFLNNLNALIFKAKGFGYIKYSKTDNEEKHAISVVQTYLYINISDISVFGIEIGVPLLKLLLLVRF